MSQIIWRSSRQFPNTRSAMRWWRNKRLSDLPFRGFIWIVHGLGEHSGRYDEVANFLAGLDFDVVSIDLPGHGLSRSEGDQSKLPSIHEAVTELQDTLHYWLTEGPLSRRGLAQYPWFLVGHSLGALISLSWILKGKSPEFTDYDFAKRAFISAPPLRLRMPVPAWKKALAEGIRGWLPDLKLNNEIDPSYLSYDPINISRYQSDPLNHPYASPKLFLSVLEATADVWNRPQDIEIPIFLGVGRDDGIVDPSSVKEYYDKLGTHKAFQEYAHSKHEILNDVERQKVFEGLASWFL